MTPTSVTIRYLGWATVFSDATVDESRTSNGRTPRATTTGTGFYFVTFPAANPVTNFRHASVQVTTLDEFRVVCEVGTRHVDPLTHDYTVGVVCIRSETGAEANAAFSLQVLV